MVAKKNVEAWKISESDERECAKAFWCFSPLSARRHTKTNWIKGKRLAMANVDGQRRVFALVSVTKRRKGKALDPVCYWMDAITGSFYGVESLRCLTNPELVMRGVKETPKAADILLEWKIEPERREFTYGKNEVVEYETD